MAVGVLLALAAGLAAASGSPSWSGGEGAGDRSLPMFAHCSGMGIEGTVRPSSAPLPCGEEHGSLTGAAWGAGLTPHIMPPASPLRPEPVYASSGGGMAPPASRPRNDALRCPRTIRGYHPCTRSAASPHGPCPRGDKPFPGRAQVAWGRRVSLGKHGRAARWSVSDARCLSRVGAADSDRCAGATSLTRMKPDTGLCRGPLDHARRAAGMGSAPCSATRGRGVTAFTAAPEGFTGPDVQKSGAGGLTERRAYGTLETEGTDRAAIVTPNGDLIRSGEAARMLGISRSTLDRWVKAGKVRYFELSPYGERRFDPKDIRALLREGKAKAEPPSEGQEG